uniref:Uncharacterized protein n=1 Tax=Cairina moschata TaxID=8855 RepID=A0A8C3BXY7_CAIMO
MGRGERVAAPIRAGLWHAALGAAGDPLVTAAASCSCPGFAPWVGLFSPLALLIFLRLFFLLAENQENLFVTGHCRPRSPWSTEATL